MASGQTSIRKRPYPLETDTPDVAADMYSLALALDTAPVATQGTLANRPASAVSGNLYMVWGDSTNANNGILWWDSASGWVEVGSVLSSLTVHGSGTVTSLTVSGNAVVTGQLTVQTFLSAAKIGGSAGSTGGVTLVDNNGHAITMAWTGSTLQFYVDGTPVSVS